MRIAAVLSVVAIATGCSVEQSPVAPQTSIPVSTSGALVVDWTVASSAAPDSCVAAGASAFEIAILDSAEQHVGSFQQSCNAFTTSVDLDEGIYAAEARLIGETGMARTRPVRIDFFTIRGQSQLTQAIDFPATVFVGRGTE